MIIAKLQLILTPETRRSKKRSPQNCEHILNREAKINQTTHMPMETDGSSKIKSNKCPINHNNVQPSIKAMELMANQFLVRQKYLRWNELWPKI